MANRVTEIEVKKVINTDLSNAIVLVHIQIANDLVTGTLGSSGLGTSRLKHIELFLAAHFIGIGMDKEEGMMLSQWAGEDGKIDYNKTLGRALNATFYGQQAQLLDTTGVLAQTGKSRAQFRVI